MPNLIKKAVITGAIVATSVIGSAVVSNLPDEPKGQTMILLESVNGIPKGTVMEWNNGKYVPQSVPGYESKADYPDKFWIYDYKNTLKDKAKTK